jgi:acyl-CoA hydrolase
MKFHTRKWVKPEDLNPNGTLFGGRLLAWIDEEAALYTVVQLDNPQIVTKFITEIDFISTATEGDIIEIGIEATHFGTASITLRAEVRNMMTKKTIITIEKIIMVNLNKKGKPSPHGKTKIEFVEDRLK